jgi:hypothetical protein
VRLQLGCSSIPRQISTEKNWSLLQCRPIQYRRSSYRVSSWGIGAQPALSAVGSSSKFFLSVSFIRTRTSAPSLSGLFTLFTCGVKYVKNRSPWYQILLSAHLLTCQPSSAVGNQMICHERNWSSVQTVIMMILLYTFHHIQSCLDNPSGLSPAYSQLSILNFNIHNFKAVRLISVSRLISSIICQPTVLSLRFATLKRIEASESR